MKEATTVGISKIHFRHMKACTQSTALSNFEATIYHIPYSTGYSLLDWQTVVNTMIQKKRKGNKVTELRILNLMEVEFNFNNKVIARDLLFCAESNDLIPNEQYGSRHKHCAAG